MCTKVTLKTFWTKIIHINSIHVNRLVKPINISLHDFHQVVLILSFSLLLFYYCTELKDKEVF